jgi:hypothetical protein
MEAFTPMRVLLALVFAFPLLQPVQQAPAVAPAQTATSTMIWIGRHAEVEEFLKSAKVDRIENIPKGVTRPRRVFFAPGGLAAGAVIKQIRPSRFADYYDSYRSEVGAYELDKLLDMDMVPPTVERAVGIDLVSMQLWVEECVSYKSVMNKPRPNPEVWARQLRRMIVFDNLIVNIDRNEGNMLIDPVGNLVLIDHSRSFDARTPLRMPFEKSMTAIDRPFYERLKALDAKALNAHVGRWVDFGVGPILAQRDAIVEKFEQLIKEKGEANVIFK